MKHYIRLKSKPTTNKQQEKVIELYSLKSQLYNAFIDDLDKGLLVATEKQGRKKFEDKR